ncbi:MAG TPA: DUF4399 domain-containing protein [Gemmatimonadales bacterium]|nr:DUF4399 domain-containing protein [Gemmatimonadales bacterium]
MRVAPLSAILVLLTGCADRPPATTMAATSQILSPADGDTVSAEVLVRLGVTGARAVPADGTRLEGEGHHHLFVDADLTPADSAIPKSDGIYHIGSGADTLRLQGLAPGTHRLITRFAYGDHVPMAGVATDTIWIVVR